MQYKKPFAYKRSEPASSFYQSKTTFVIDNNAETYSKQKQTYVYMNVSKN